MHKQKNTIFMPMNGIRLHSEHRTGVQWHPAGMHVPVRDAATSPSVWSIPISTNSSLAERYSDMLHADELNKGLRFHQDKHRTRYLVGRIVLRHLLGQALATDPKAVRFTYGLHRKPFLEHANQSFSFNLSYTEDHVIIALDPAMPVGIDIERVNTGFEFDSMAEICFSDREIRYIGHSHEHFFTLWTRKEAILKLSGKGIGEHLPSVEVLDGTGEAQRDNVGEVASSALQLYTFAPQPTLLASLATARPFEEFAFYRWEDGLMPA